jgi:hypothetical protein
MRAYIIALAACSGLTLAQNHTLEFFWPHAADYQSPAVTIKSVNASATVFHVACPEPTTSDHYPLYNCDWEGGVDYTVFNSSTYEATMTGYSSVLTRTCEAKGQEGVNCYMEGRDDRIIAVSAANEVWADDITNTITATVASGGEKLRAVTQSAFASLAMDSAASPAATPSATSGKQVVATAAGSTGGVPQVTGAASNGRAGSLVLLALFGAGVAFVHI